MATLATSYILLVVNEIGRLGGEKGGGRKGLLRGRGDLNGLTGIIRSKVFRTYTTLLVRHVISYNRNEFITINRSIHPCWLLLLFFLENEFQTYYYVLKEVITLEVYIERQRKKNCPREKERDLSRCCDRASMVSR